MEEKWCWSSRGRENLEPHCLEKTLTHYPLDLDMDRELDMDGKTLDPKPWI
jgi:hypothetical protein